jgi:hypothetical protein
MPAAELTYIEAVAESDGRTSVAQGVLRMGGSTMTPGRHGVRIYRVDRNVYPEGRLSWQTIQGLQEALQRVVRNLRITVRPVVIQSGIVRIGGSARARQVPRYAVVQLGGRQRVNQPPPESSDGSAFVTWLDAWRRNATPDEVVVEVQADAGELEAIARDLAPAADEAVDAALPEETDASAAKRDSLLRSWLTAADVADKMGSRATNRGALASRLRRDGELLGVWVVSENGYRHPDWQFDANSRRPYPAMKEALALLRGPGGPMHQRATSGWEEVEWFLQPRASLGGSAPYALLATAPERVIDCANTDVAEGRDASW